MEINQNSKAAFSFTNYRVENIFYNEYKDHEKLTVNFDPTGTYFPETGIFNLSLNCTTIEDQSVETTGKKILDVTLIAMFQFEAGMTFEQIPPYFYRNAIAIVYPYIRAFISNLTLLSNTKLLLLPVMNLSALEELLKSRTTAKEYDM